MKKYEVNSNWGLIPVEVEESKTCRQILEDFLNTKNVQYKILDEHKYGKVKHITQFHVKYNDVIDEIDIIEL